MAEEQIKQFIDDHRNPRHENIISTVNLNCKLDFEDIASRNKHADYYPECVNALIMRFRNPKSVALLSPSGKMVCIGAKTNREAYTIALYCFDYLDIMGYPVHFKDFKIEGARPTITKRLPFKGKCLLRRPDTKDDMRCGAFLPWIGNYVKLLLGSLGLKNCLSDGGFLD